MQSEARTTWQAGPREFDTIEDAISYAERNDLAEITEVTTRTIHPLRDEADPCFACGGYDNIQPTNERGKVEGGQPPMCGTCRDEAAKQWKREHPCCKLAGTPHSRCSDL